MPEKNPAVILGTDVSALNVTRSLGRRGVPVTVVGVTPRDYAAASRYSRFAECEDLNNEEKVLRTLHKIAETATGKPVLFATADLHVRHISRSRGDLSKKFHFVLPDDDVIDTLMDKRKFSRFAASRGFRTPPTFFSGSREELERISLEVKYPCVVKPLYRTAYWSRNVPPEKKVMKALSAGELLDRVESLDAFAESLVVQEWIPGGDEEVHFCLACLDREGRPLALFTGRKLRQYPPLTGVTSLAESRRCLEVEEMALKILAESRCAGLCSVEFKRNPADGSFVITEPTVGRVDLQEGVSTLSGLDIPYIAYRDAIGEKQEPASGYRDGVIWVNEPFEFNSLLAGRRANGDGSTPFFRHYKGERAYALLAGDDHGPFLLFLKAAGRRGIHHALKRVAGS